MEELNIAKHNELARKLVLADEELAKAEKEIRKVKRQRTHAIENVARGDMQIAELKDDCWHYQTRLDEKEEKI